MKIHTARDSWSTHRHCTHMDNTLHRSIKDTTTIAPISVVFPHQVATNGRVGMNERFRASLRRVGLGEGRGGEGEDSHDHGETAAA